MGARNQSVFKCIHALQRERSVCRAKIDRFILGNNVNRRLSRVYITMQERLKNVCEGYRAGAMDNDAIDHLLYAAGYNMHQFP